MLWCRERRELTADSHPLRRRATVHTSYWPSMSCCSAVLQSPGAKAWLDWFLFTLLQALDRTGGVGAACAVKKQCHPGRLYSSLFIEKKHLLPFAQAGTVLPRGPGCLTHSSLPSLSFPLKKKENKTKKGSKDCFNWSIDFSLLSLSPPPFPRVPAKQSAWHQNIIMKMDLWVVSFKLPIHSKIPLQEKLFKNCFMGIEMLKPVYCNECYTYQSLSKSGVEQMHHYFQPKWSGHANTIRAHIVYY